MNNWKTILLNLLQLAGILATALVVPSPDTAAILAMLPDAAAEHIGKIGLALIAAKPTINIIGDFLDNGKLDKSWPPTKTPLVILALCLAAGFTGCATDANGAKKYVGPSFGVSAGYQGITVGFQLYGEPSQFGAKATVPLESGTVGVTVGQAVELPADAK